MLRPQFLLFGIAIAVISITTVRAMPFSRLQTDLVVPVAAGCGLGVNRALDYGCYPIYPPSYLITLATMGLTIGDILGGGPTARPVADADLLSDA